jgi:aryl-alcohol dehydrogenase-like predicted oxidoreductase
MQRRRLGTSGLEVSAIGLGCMSMTGGYSDKPDRQEMISLLRTAVDRGAPRPDPGTRRLRRLEENLGAADVELSADELTEIEDAASKIQVQGGRYNEAAERMTNF